MPNPLPTPRKPDAVAFDCPKCGASFLSETGASVEMRPPVCGFGHKPTEMEQRYLGADAYRRAASS